MEFATQKELYLKLLPVFTVKKRLMSITKYKHLTNEDIWTYLIETKWRKSYDLSLSDIVNDIINVDIDKVNNYMGGK